MDKPIRSLRDVYKGIREDYKDKKRKHKHIDKVWIFYRSEMSYFGHFGGKFE